MKEEIIVIKKFSIIGILTYGKLYNKKLPTIVIFNAGVIHKIGPNRIYVKLARKLSDAGYNVFRFDYGGQGDSLSRLTDFNGCGDTENFDEIFNFLEKKINISSFIVMGLCSGAEKAYQTALYDSRIIGVVMINGTGLNEYHLSQLSSLANKRVQLRYYKKAFWIRSRWLKLLNAKSAISKLYKVKFLFFKLFKRKFKEKTDVQLKQLINPFRILSNKEVSVFLILAEGSIAYDLINIIQKQCYYDFKFVLMKDVDHIITPVWAQNELCETIIDWCNSQFDLPIEKI